jgi:hypothetical protein
LFTTLLCTTLLGPKNVNCFTIFYEA